MTSAVKRRPARSPRRWVLRSRTWPITPRSTKEFTFYVVYGSCVHSVNYEDIHVITVESDVMSMEDTNDYIREHIGRRS